MAITQQHWDKAPVWANYMAQDANGEIWAYEVKPVTTGLRYWNSLDQTRATFCGTDTDTYGWRTSMQKRPVVEAVKYDPTWNNAPEKARWHAIDLDGTGWYYENRPTRGISGWYAKADAGSLWRNADCYLGHNFADWHLSLTERPIDHPLYVPDWKDAPDKAQWHAIDSDGRGWWYLYEPVMGTHAWYDEQGDKETALTMWRDGHCSFDRSYAAWKQSLTKRPDSQPTAQEYVPDWSTAPEKAEFHAIDKDGRGWWYQDEPLALRAGWHWSGNTEIWRNLDCNMQYGLDGWERSLTKRPAQAPRPMVDNRKDKELIDLRVENVALKAQNSALRGEIARLLKENGRKGS